MIDWHKVKTTSDLLAMRTKQFVALNHDRQLAAKSNEESRVRAAQDFARRHARTLIADSYSPGTLVLIYQAKFDVNSKFAGKKYRDRWAGPFRVRRYLSTGAYKLEELDGTPMKGSVAANRVKVFFKRTGEPKVLQAQDLSDSDTDIEELEPNPLVDWNSNYLHS